MAGHVTNLATKLEDPTPLRSWFMSYNHRLRGFWVAGGQISPSPIDFHRRPLKNNNDDLKRLKNVEILVAPPSEWTTNKTNFVLIWIIQTRSSAIAEGPRDASCQLKSCQLPRNSAETTYTTSPDQIDGMKLEI